MSDPVESAAWAALDAKLDPKSVRPIAVAVSGGGDSVALMHLAASWAARAGRELLVLTVDHGLQPESAGWARRVQAQAAELGLNWRRLRWTGPKPVTGVPARARTERHRLLAEAAREADARVILLGHTRDDHREGLVIRAEGTPIGDLRLWAPSPAWPEGRGVFLLRPLLPLGRDALRAWLRGHGVHWLEDPANADPVYARARLRLESAPLRNEPALDWTEFDRRRSSALDGATAEADGRLLMARSAVDALRPAIACAAGASRPVRRERLQRLAEALADGSASTATLGGARIRLASERVELSRDLGRRTPAPAPIRAGASTVWDGRFEICAQTDGVILPAAGLQSALSNADRARLRTSPPAVRPTLPLLQTVTGAVMLAPAASLVGERLRAALGGIGHEAEIV